MISTYITIASVSILAAMSPGPDFFMVLKNSLTRWRIHGILTAVWVGVALVAHSLIIWIWLWALIEASVVLYQVIKIAWALYLLYLAYNLLFTSDTQEFSVTKEDQTQGLKHSFLKSFIDWFVTNILNPKALVFIIALYTQVFGHETTLNQYLIAWVIVWWITCIRFCFLAYIINVSYIRKTINKMGGWIQKIFGIILWWLWLKILTE